MKTNNVLKRVILDTPNILFYGENNRNKQVEENTIAILNLLALDVKVIASITPKMLKEIPRISEFLKLAIRSRDGISIPTKNKDPDEVVLQIADVQNIPIITNDKFRQEKYQKYKSRSRVIRFFIESYSLIPKNDSWKEYLLGSNDNV